MKKLHFNDEFLVLLWPLISRLFTCSNEEKKLKKTKGACYSPIFMAARCTKNITIPLQGCLFGQKTYTHGLHLFCDPLEWNSTL
jgi:hypothetical protein